MNLDALRAGQPAGQPALHCEVFRRNIQQHEATAFKSFQCRPSNVGANPMSFFTFWKLLAVASVHLADHGWPWLTKIIQDPKGRRLLTKDIYGLTKISQPIWRHAQRSSKIHGVSTRGKFIPSPTPSFNKRIFQLTAAILEGCRGWSPLRP